MPKNDFGQLFGSAFKEVCGIAATKTSMPRSIAALGAAAAIVLTGLSASAAVHAPQHRSMVERVRDDLKQVVSAGLTHTGPKATPASKLAQGPVRGGAPGSSRHGFSTPAPGA